MDSSTAAVHGPCELARSSRARRRSMAARSSSVRSSCSARTARGSAAHGVEDDPVHVGVLDVAPPCPHCRRVGIAGAAGVGVGDRPRVDHLDRIDLDDAATGSVAMPGDNLAASPTAERARDGTVGDPGPELLLEQHRTPTLPVRPGSAGGGVEGRFAHLLANGHNRRVREGTALPVRAVDHEGVAGDEACVRRRQERGRPTEFAQPAHP